jgi:hypothetical protein
MTASSLQHDLALLASKASPNLITVQDFEETLSRMACFGIGFMGGLPPNKPFGFPSNATSRSSFPMTANSIPYYKRDATVRPAMSAPPTIQLMRPVGTPMSTLPMNTQNSQVYSNPTYSSMNTPGARPPPPFSYMTPSPQHSLAATPSRLYYGGGMIPSTISPGT